MCGKVKAAEPKAPVSTVSKFKVGDKVKIVRKVTSEAGWRNSWTHLMDADVGNGKTYTVSRLSETGVSLAGAYYGWPEGALELVTEKAPSFPFKVGDKVRMVEDYNGFKKGDAAVVNHINPSSESELTLYTLKKASGDFVVVFGSRFEVINEFAPAVPFKAKAEVKVTETKETIMVPQEVVTKHETVTLELSKQQAKFLALLVIHVGGDPKESVRGHAEPIHRAFKAVGIDAGFGVDYEFGDERPLTGALICKSGIIPAGMELHYD